MKKEKIYWLINGILLTLLAVADVLYIIPLNCSAYITKTIASALFVIIALFNFTVVLCTKRKSIKPYVYLMLIGTIFAFGGDVFLIDHFIIGAILFAIGHIFYFISFCFIKKFRLIDLAYFVGIFGFALLVIFLYPGFDFDGMLPLVIAYACIISLMLGKAISNAFAKSEYKSANILIAIGAFLFFISDMFLMFNVFANLPRIFDILCLATYYPAQGLLASSILYLQKDEGMNIFKKTYCRIYQICFRAILPLLPYREPKILNNNEEVVNALKSQNKNTVLFVTDKTIRNLGLTKSLESTLAKNNIKVVVFDEVLPNPTISLVEQGRDVYLKENCDCIIALGGGSVIDCAKTIGARIVKPKKSVRKMKGLLKIRKKLPLLIAIPTTAGTGSETTLAAVITDDENHFKYAINDFSLIPHYALLDENLTLGLNQKITSTTGMDALTHAVEAYIGRSTTKHTRKAALDAIILIKENLVKAYDNGKDKTARANMLHASYLAGVAFTQSYVGYIHAIAHSLGGQYGVPHGLANAIILPVMLRQYGKSAYKKLAKIAKAIGLAEATENNESSAEKFISWIEDLNKHFGIPKFVENIKEEDIALMAKHADKEGNPLYPVPKLMNAKNLEEVYKKLMKA